jgi:gas vesicle protein
LGQQSRHKFIERGKNMGKLAMFGCFWAGIGAGAVIGILFAPKSGVETRDEIARKVQESKDYAQKKVTELQARAEDLVETGLRAPERVAAAFDAGRLAYQKEMSKLH